LPTEALTAIRGLAEDPVVAAKVSHFSVQENGSKLYVFLSLANDPDFHPNSEASCEQAELVTDLIARETVEVLNQHQAVRDMQVAAHLPSEDFGEILVGGTIYSQSTNSYEWVGCFLDGSILNDPSP
jgi:hypothetical protein